MADALPDRPLQIVAVDDEEDDVELVRLSLARGALSSSVTRASCEDELLRELARAPDMLLCDYNMPGFSAERVLQLLNRLNQPAPLIVLTRAIGEQAVVELFRAGATDYLAKDKLALLPSVIRRVWAQRAGERARLRMAEQLAEAVKRLRTLSAHLVEAQERERGAVARELHDGLGQTLSGIVIQLQAGERSRDEVTAHDCNRRALSLATEAIEQVKTLSFMLRPAQLEVLGFAGAARATLDRQLERTGIAGHLMVRGTPHAKPHTGHAVALRILQEALTNVIRHAGASRVVVRLRFVDDQRLVMAVGDDGRGFDVAARLQGGVAPYNLGLYGMLERAELSGGRLRIRSRPGKGTLVRCVL
jgi:signal transduction histidine kinase